MVTLYKPHSNCLKVMGYPLNNFISAKSLCLCVKWTCKHKILWWIFIITVDYPSIDLLTKQNWWKWLPLAINNNSNSPWLGPIFHFKIAQNRCGSCTYIGSSHSLMHYVTAREIITRHSFTRVCTIYNKQQRKNCVKWNLNIKYTETI